MKTLLLLCVPFMLIGADAWIPRIRNPFESEPKVHIIKDCMHVTLEEGDFIYNELPQIIKGHYDKNKYMPSEPAIPSKVCGLYISSKPDTIIEVKMKYVNVDCESGGLMAFVDGWELNGQYFPPPENHQRKFSERVVEFCSDPTNNWLLPPRKQFQSSQNAALLQYRIPKHGSFRVNVRFRKISEPCNIMMHDANNYILSNYGKHQNCSITALFPIVVSLRKFKVGSRSNYVDHDCKQEDRIEIGGTGELDTANMEKIDNVCGYSDNIGVEKAVFCGVSSVHLISSGNYFNEAEIFIRQAVENDIDLPNVICSS